MSHASRKIVAVIGATGAQGLPVVRHLLKNAEDGSPSPYKVRALTRDPEHPRAKQLLSQGVELVKGSYSDKEAIKQLFEGSYGAYVNTDSYSGGAGQELIDAINIYEAARIAKVKHYVWSGLDYALKKGNWDPIYKCDHYNAKGRFSEFLKSQELSDGSGFDWTIFTTGPYFEGLSILFAPTNIREDGTRVFATPIGTKAALPFIALDDCGWWARYIFDHRETTRGKDLEVASEPTTMPKLVETFSRVTGHPAIYKELGIDDFFRTVYTNADEVPVAMGAPVEEGGTSFRQNFSAAFSLWRDGLASRDMGWVQSVHPNAVTLEQFLKESGFVGKFNPEFLKGSENRKRLAFNFEEMRKM